MFATPPQLAYSDTLGMFPAQNNQLEADSLASEDEEDLSDELCPDCQVQRLTHPQETEARCINNVHPTLSMRIQNVLDSSGGKTSLQLTLQLLLGCELRFAVRHPNGHFAKAFVAVHRARHAARISTVPKNFAKTAAIAIPSSTPSSTFLSNAGMTPSVSAPHPPSHPLAGPSTLAPAGPYARMIPAHYAAKILRQDFSYTKTTQKEMETLERESETRIWIKFWNTNDQGPITFHPLVSRFPFFEPAKCDDMTRKLGSPCIFYEMLDLRHLRLEEIDEGDEVWISTSGPIKVTADMTLYLRAPDIHTCLRLRTSVNSQTSSPQKHALYGGSDTLDQSPSKKQRTYAPIDESSPPPPTPSPSPSPSRSLSNLSSFSTGLEPPPHGRRSLFPLAYTSDMDAAFHQIQRLPQSYTAEQQFTSVFGFLGDSFRSSTYSDSYNAWLYGDADMIAKAVACGSNPGGEWSRIVTYYRKNMQELKQKGKRSFT
ncbi:hypothetical protein R3P38DRAFT_3249631 [Favolaschia claudopus]|uniref:Uncharacterized protein n=1 Tax=Favolaschia claudopus TaxID=2862362 RepID=A0AAW0EHJ6_9AGAR